MLSRQENSAVLLPSITVSDVGVDTTIYSLRSNSKGEIIATQRHNLPVASECDRSHVRSIMCGQWLYALSQFMPSINVLLDIYIV